jgi:HlyD family secretion protein
MIRPASPSVTERHVEAFDPAPPPEKPNKVSRPATGRRRRNALLILALLGSAVIASSYYIFLRPSPQPNALTTEGRPPAVVGLGYIEPSSTVIKIGAPGSPDALRIGTLNVVEGDEVEAGQVLATLDTAYKLAAQVRQSEAQAQLKRLILDRQRREVAYTVASRRAAIERARAALDSARAEHERQLALVDRSVATLSNLEKKRMEFLTAQATVREMEAALERIEAEPRVPTRSASGTVIDVAVAEQELTSAEAELDVALASLELATIRAPFKGRVLAVKARAGERIGSDGVLELGATQSMRAVIEVYQVDIGRVRVGQTVSIRTEVLPKPLTGAVERISPVVKRQGVVNNDPATATDARVIEVYVAFDEVASRTVAALSRLQVQGVFER